MTDRAQIWKCEVCGNVVEVHHRGADSLVCCNSPMVLKYENAVDGIEEKHVPVIEGRKVMVGSVMHPMTEDHYIEWIEVMGSGGEVCKRFLKPGDIPAVEFCFDIVGARCYCNLHGTWAVK
jgi:superoxide reductase